MSRAYRCERCDGGPQWRLERRGDVVTSWACDDHLVQVLKRLQRWFETTDVVVSPYIAAGVRDGLAAR